MDSKKIMEQVGQQNTENWKNSDIESEYEVMLWKMAEHFKKCEKCRKDFDEQEYGSENLIQFVDKYLIRAKLSDWICG